MPINANHQIRTHYHKPRFRCQVCGRQFVELAAIARVTEVFERWLMCSFVGDKHNVPRKPMP
ncbi:hypothetical protein [Chroogloeocystis siderophila]|uniref:hypothetical protein n=1 Tax=Chroogloeocystis siderophila TaxID=329163 RepID=UPI0011613AD7|nr:hypothetical protein [Chroogloeocystis siderophila]